MEPAEPWQLVIGYSEYRKQLSNMQALIYKNSQLSPVKNLTDKYADQPSTVVIVIGESTNRQHMSLYGYPRETNPKLSSIKDQLAIFTHVVSARPYTIESLEQVLTFADEENPDLVMKKPSLMNIMKQAGYKTFWITNQQTLTKRNTMLTTFSKQMDVQYYMNNSRAQNSREYDQNVFEPLKKVLSDKAQRKFIVVHLLGTHMKYDYRYPPEFDQFNDNKGITSNVDENKIKVINSYDNAVLYNDYIVYNIIKTLAETKQATLMTYFSDHGEDVYDSPPHEMLGRNEGKPTLSMYAVPFIIWNSPEWKNNHSENLNKNLNRPYSTSHFIHTWADLVGLNFEDFDAKKSIINPAFVNRPLLIGDPQIKGGLRELKQ
jgi:heptose-I-phosphate ethanolaminephosphotransferase